MERLSAAGSLDLTSAALAEQFRLLIKRAKRARLSVVVDSDSIAIRLIPTATVDAGKDLRGLGDAIAVHGACGGGGANVSGDAVNYGAR